MAADTFVYMVKETNKKKNDTKDRSKPRMYDLEGYRRRVDSVIFRNEDRGHILLVSSRGQPDSWTIPGGGIEPCETPKASAVREALEEAGVICEAAESLGIFEDNDKMIRTEAICLTYTGQDEQQWDDKFEWGRSRKWFTVSEAIDILRSRNKYDKIPYFALAGCRTAAATSRLSLSSSPSLSSISPSTSSMASLCDMCNNSNTEVVVGLRYEPLTLSSLSQKSLPTNSCSHIKCIS